MTNPYQSPSNVSGEVGIFADHAQLIRATFLFRKIEFQLPFHGQLTYSGWWFWQRVYINRVRVWSRISWLRIEPNMEFPLPPETGLSRGRIEIGFSRGLTIRRFRVWFDQELVFDQIG